MKKGIHLTKTEFALIVLALLFTASMFLYNLSRRGEDTWQVTTERTGQVEKIVPVNINTATEEELMAVEGIGPTLAQRIVEYREKHGAFQTVEELDNVKGIGMSLIESIRYLVCTEDGT